LTGDLFNAYEDQIEALTLIPSSEGRFEVSVDDELLYAKSKKGRHPEEGEVVDLFGEYVEE
jgi:selT/selW/selH-like putative selenoprotein